MSIDFIPTRFIQADIKLSKILKNISNSMEQSPSEADSISSS
jgi:hypothetical protein